MLKLSRCSFARNLLSNKQFLEYGPDVRDARYLCAFTSRAGVSTTRQNFTAKGNFAGRVFAPYSIYKGKAALSMEPVLPTFAKLDSGGLRVDRRGVMMLTFLPAIGERKYDWQSRQKFALSATEVGSFISLGPTGASEFFHDPSMKSSNAGQVKKTLSVKPHADASGYFISLSVNNSILKTTERITVPVTSAEFQVMKTACSV
ncbi:single-stranded DNA-binding protein WHY2, mitochondrial isoform X2 [Carica papaya]|uniref:single-stranded DNA-binding protein WHY2, mitochondrial isoform X2 n=1 Tax=Carica papaya TaxID=3649 RepID=UPI000B8C9634|nr:single-stranded DNA-binding protein WHY2, mitochondrial isoform X2 [Carica papaya]